MGAKHLDYPIRSFIVCSFVVVHSIAGSSKRMNSDPWVVICILYAIIGSVF